MMREPRYGELMSTRNKEAHLIWMTRNVEPEPCECHGMTSDYTTDPDDEVNADYAAKFWGLLETLTPREAKVLSLRHVFDLTLDEIGGVLCLTPERIRQIEAKARRKLVHPERMGPLGDLPDRWRLAKRDVEARQPKYAWSDWYEIKK